MSTSTAEQSTDNNSDITEALVLVGLLQALINASNSSDSGYMLKSPLSIESSHPYNTGIDEYQLIEISSSDSYSIIFSDETSTELNYDYIRFYKDEQYDSFWGEEKYSGGYNGTNKKFPGIGSMSPLVIPATRFIVHFHSDGSNNDWGYKMTITATPRILSVGDKVLIRKLPLEEAKLAQQGHGGWSDKLEGLLGKHGVIVSIDSDGDIVVIFPEGVIAMWNSTLVDKFIEPEPVTLAVNDFVILSPFSAAVVGASDGPLDEFDIGVLKRSIAGNLPYVVEAKTGLKQGTTGNYAKNALVKLPGRVNGRVPVGCYVKLAAGYETAADASDGPLTTRDVGMLVKDDGTDNKPFKVVAVSSSKKNQCWWYEEDALCLLTEELDEDSGAIMKTFTVTVHPHPLKLNVRTTSGWSCDGRSLPGGCRKGCTGFNQTAGWTNYCCLDCDYDLCEECMNTYSTSHQSSAPRPVLASSVVLESSHPYGDNMNSYEVVDTPGAGSYSITFDSQSCTELNYDYVRFYKDDTHTEYWGEEKYSGGRGGSAKSFPGVDGKGALLIPSNRFVVHFHSDGSNTDWGYKMTVTSMPAYLNSSAPRPVLASSVVLESSHPYGDNMNSYDVVDTPGAGSYSITFDSQSCTELNYDYIRFYKDDTHTECWGDEKYSGGRGGSAKSFPGVDGKGPLLIPSHRFVVHFHSDGSNTDWGYKMTVNIIPVRYNPGDSVRVRPVSEDIARSTQQGVAVWDDSHKELLGKAGVIVTADHDAGTAVVLVETSSGQCKLVWSVLLLKLTGQSQDNFAVRDVVMLSSDFMLEVNPSDQFMGLHDFGKVVRTDTSDVPYCVEAKTGSKAGTTKWFPRWTLRRPPGPVKGRITVGSRVKLAVGYESKDDASSGPLTASDVGVVMKDDSSGKPYRVIAVTGPKTGAYWWYKQDALCHIYDDARDEAFSKPYLISVEVSTHNHVLCKDIRSSGRWACDGRSLPGGCRKGCTGFDQTAGWTNYCCYDCDYDLCEECMKQYCTTNALTLDSSHPYAHNADEYIPIQVSGASSYSITFDSQSCTELNYDYVRFYKDDTHTEYWGEQKYSGGRGGSAKSFPGLDGKGALLIPSHRFVVHFHSDGSNNDWGYKMTVSSIPTIFCKGDIVSILQNLSVEERTTLQQGHGGWAASMNSLVSGQPGIVVDTDANSNGSLRVQYGNSLTWNRTLITKQPATADSNPVKMKWRSSMTIRESSHPYDDDTDNYEIVEIPGAESYSITFDSQSCTEQNYDYIRFYKDDTHTEYWGEQKYSGGRGGSAKSFPGVDGKGALLIPSNRFVVHFRSDGSNTDWGYKMTVSSIPPLVFPGDEVFIRDLSVDEVGREQSAFGGWREELRPHLGKKGVVWKAGSDGRVVVQFGARYTLNPRLLEKAQADSVVTVVNSSSSQGGGDGGQAETRSIPSQNNSIASEDDFLFGSDDDEEEEVVVVVPASASDDANILNEVVRVSVHSHLLIKKRNQTLDWTCDGMNLLGGCKKGCSGPQQTRGWLQFDCTECNYCLCAGCVRQYVVDEDVAQTVKVIESSHPYGDNMNSYEVVNIPGAGSCSITFDSQSCTERNYDYIRFYKDDTHTECWGDEKYSGGRGGSAKSFPGVDGKGALLIPSNRFVVHFYSDGSNNDWGYKMTVISITTIFLPGDQVEILNNITIDDIKEKQKGFGGWFPNMNSLIAKRGAVESKNSGGSLTVYFGSRYTFNPLLIITHSEMQGLDVSSRLSRLHEFKSSSVVLESSHPYGDYVNSYEVVDTPGAGSYSITFDSQSCTELNYDYVRFYKDDTHTECWGEQKYSGGRGGSAKSFPGVGGKGALLIPSNRFVVHFYSDGSNNDWGYKLTVTSMPDYFKTGSKVSVLPVSVQEARKAQTGHGGWIDSMAASLGNTGIVVKTFPSGDVGIQFGEQFQINPNLLRKCTDVEISELNSTAVEEENGIGGKLDVEDVDNENGENSGAKDSSEHISVTSDSEGQQGLPRFTIGDRVVLAAPSLVDGGGDGGAMGGPLQKDDVGVVEEYDPTEHTVRVKVTVGLRTGSSHTYAADSLSLYSKKKCEELGIDEGLFERYDDIMTAFGHMKLREIEEAISKAKAARDIPLFKRRMEEKKCIYINHDRKETMSETQLLPCLNSLIADVSERCNTLLDAEQYETAELCITLQATLEQLLQQLQLKLQISAPAAVPSPSTLKEEVKSDDGKPTATAFRSPRKSGTGADLLSEGDLKEIHKLFVFLNERCGLSHKKSRLYSELMYNSHDIESVKKLQLLSTKGTIRERLLPFVGDDDIDMIISELKVISANSDNSPLSKSENKVEYDTPYLNLNLRTAYRSNVANFNFIANGQVIANVKLLSSEMTEQKLASNDSFRGIFTGHISSPTGKFEVLIKVGDSRRDLEAEYATLTYISSLAKDEMGCVRLIDYSPMPPYIVLEKFGEDLRFSFKSFATIKQVKPFIIELIRVIESLHSIGIMHGDLKPQNILFRLDKNFTGFKLCDFENSRKVGEEMPLRKYTKAWVAPEVYFATDKKRIVASLEVDVFSLGLILGVLLDGNCSIDKTILPQDDDISFQRALTDDSYLQSLLPCSDGHYYTPWVHDMCRLDPKARCTARSLLKYLEGHSQTQLHLQNQQLGKEITFIKDNVGSKLSNIESKLDRVLMMVTVGFESIQNNLKGLLESAFEHVLNNTDESSVLNRVLASTAELSEALKKVREPQDAKSELKKLESSIHDIFKEHFSAYENDRQKEMSDFQGSITVSLDQMGSLLESQQADSVEFKQMLGNIIDRTNTLREGLNDLKTDLESIKNGLVQLSETTRAVLGSQEDLLRAVAGLHSEASRMSAEETERFNGIQDRISSLQSSLQGTPQMLAILSAQMREQKQLLVTLMRGAYEIPTLCILLPVISQGLKDILRDPFRLVKDRYRLFFLCSHSLCIAPCGPDGQGYPLSVPKEWVRRAAPVLKVGLIMLKLALVAGGIPFPIAGIFDQLSNVDVSVQSRFFDATLASFDDDTPQIDSAENSNGSGTGSTDIWFRTSLHDINQIDTTPMLSQLNRGAEGTRAAYEEIKKMLQGPPAYNIPATCGLLQAEHKGKIAWVLPMHVTHWMESIDLPQNQQSSLSLLPHRPLPQLLQANEGGTAAGGAAATPIRDHSIKSKETKSGIIRCNWFRR